MKERIEAWARGLKGELSALWLACRRGDTPPAAKVLAALAVCYALSPIDLIPDFVPVLGYLDDLLVLPVLIWGAVRLLPPSLLEECRAQALDLWRQGRPKSWRYALPILALWLLLAVWLLRVWTY